MAGRKKLPPKEKKKVIRLFVKTKHYEVAKKELAEAAKKYA